MLIVGAPWRENEFIKLGTGGAMTGIVIYKIVMIRWERRDAWAPDLWATGA